jgi:hypothetical protein
MLASAGRDVNHGAGRSALDSRTLGAMDVRLHEGLLCARVDGTIPKVCLLCGATKDVVRRNQEYAIGTSYGTGAGAAGGVAGAMVASSLRGLDRGTAAMAVVALVAVVVAIAVVANRATPKIAMSLPLCQRCDGRWAEGESYRLWVLVAIGLFFALVVVGMALESTPAMVGGLVVLVASLVGAYVLGLKDRFLQIARVDRKEIAMRVPEPIAQKVIERAERRAKKAAEAAKTNGASDDARDDAEPAAE